jgi:amidase
MSAIDVGGDNAGSLRVPCSWNGTFGHVTTYGTVSPRGVLGWASRFGVSDPPRDLAVLGPVARSAEDLDLALRVIAGPPADVGRAWRLQLPLPGEGGLEDLRVAVWLDERECPLDGPVRAVLDRAVACVASAGARVEEARPDFDPHEMYRTYWSMLIGSEAHLIDEHGFRRARKAVREVFGPDDAGPLPWGARAFSMYHRDWLLAMVDRRRIEERWTDFFERYDVLLCPAVPVEPIPLVTDADQVSEFECRAARRIVVNGEERDLYDLAFWSGVTILAGLPATVLPAGLTSGGLPTGLQVVGPRFADRETIRVAGLVADLLDGFVPPPRTRSTP